MHKLYFRVKMFALNSGIGKGRFVTGGLRMWSDTTLVLESGAQLIVSGRG